MKARTFGVIKLVVAFSLILAGFFGVLYPSVSFLEHAGYTATLVPGFGSDAESAVGKQDVRPGAYVLFTYTPFIDPVFTLIKSIRWAGSPYDIVVLVTDDVELATKDYDKLVDEAVIIYVVPLFFVDHPLAQRFSKFCVWALTNYKTLVYLDMDTVVTRNMDSLFLDLPGRFTVSPSYSKYDHKSWMDRVH